MCIRDRQPTKHIRPTGARTHYLSHSSPAVIQSATGFASRSVGLSEINLSDLYCGWLGRNINVEYNTIQYNTTQYNWGAVVWGYVRCLAAGGLRVRIHLKSCRVGTLGKSFTRNCSCASA